MRQRAREPARAGDFERGVRLLGRRRFVAAREPLARAVLAGGPASSWAVQELVQAYLRAGDGADAEGALRELLPESEPLLWHGLGYAHRRTGRPAEALAALERGAALRPKLRAIDLELGWMRCQAGRDREGVRMLRAAQRHFARTRDPWGESIAWSYQATRALTRFELDRALDAFLRARTLKEACGDLLGLATTWYSEGVIRHMWSELDAAREAFEKALSLQSAVGFREGQAATLSTLGVCLEEFGDRDGALRCHAAALRIMRARGGPGAHATLVHVHNNLGHLAVQRGALATAESHFRSALEQPLPSTLLDAHAVTAANLAELLLRRGRPAEALDTLTSRDSLDQPTVLLRTRIAIAIDIARARLELGDTRTALADTKRALALLSAVPGPQRRLFARSVEAHVVACRCLLAMGRTDEALEQLSQARTVEIDLVRTLAGPTQRVELAARMRDLSDLAVEASLAGLVGAREAWDAARRAKAVELRNVLVRASGKRARSGADRRAARTLAQVRALSALEHLDARGLRHLEKLKAEHVSLTRRLQRPLEKSLVTSTAPPPRLADDSALVEYHVGHDATHVFVVHRDRIEAISIGVGRAALRRLVRAYVEPLWRAARSLDPIAELSAFDLEAGRRLFHVLVRPVLDVLPAHLERLVFVPDGPLHLLPMGLLPRDDELSDASDAVGRRRYLVDTHVISHAPTSVPLPRRRASRRPRSLVAAFSPPAGTFVRRGRSVVSVEPLPRAAAEARRAARLLPRPVTLTGPRCTVGAFTAAAPSACTIHVAAHSISDEDVPAMSGIVVAAQGSGRGVDFLVSGQLVELPLEAELVILSACESARGRIWHAEGPLSLARAFLQAGARRVIATAWPVDDRTAEVVMTRTHQALHDGVDAATALTNASRELRTSSLRRSRPQAHPLFWGAFHVLEMLPSAQGTTKLQESRLS